LANSESADKTLADTAAEVVGRTLGTIVGTVERLKADHPHPISEAQELIGQGQAQVAHVAAAVGERATAVAAATGRGIKRIRRAATSSARKARGSKKIVAKAPKAKKVARKPASKPAKKAAKKAAPKAARKAKRPVKKAKRAAKRTTRPAKRSRGKARR
jgi:hypothetical protein